MLEHRVHGKVFRAYCACDRHVYVDLDGRIVGIFEALDRIVPTLVHGTVRSLPDLLPELGIVAVAAAATFRVRRARADLTPRPCGRAQLTAHVTAAPRALPATRSHSLYMHAST